LIKVKDLTIKHQDIVEKYHLLKIELNELTKQNNYLNGKINKG